MWWKNKKFIGGFSAFLLFIGLVGCIKKEIIPNSSFKEVKNPEDILIMQGYAAADAKDYAGAKEFFTQAYTLSKNPSYLKEILGILVAQHDTANAKINAYKYLEKYPKDEEVRAALVGILTNAKEFQEAIKEANILINDNKSATNYELLSSVYFLQQDFTNATKYLQKAYQFNQDEVLLDKLVAIYLLFLKDKKTAIKLYETHIQNNGISQLTGEKLALIYVEMQDFQNASRIYKSLFEELGTQKYARIALEIDFQLKDFKKAESFLSKNPKINERDKILFEVYRLEKNTKKSIEQAKIIYQNTQDANFLAYQAMMSYESTKPRAKQQIASIERDLKEAANSTNDALYWNYLGYLMIEHDFNDATRIQEGMDYVNNALQQESENAYYLDSLAWGYYKLKQCEMARELMERIPQDLRESEKEIKEHYTKILQCP